MKQDYYKILGVSADADIQTIKAAYRQRAVECHPDRGGSHEKMILINEAWQILSNPTTRSHYDFARRNQTDLSAQRTASEEAENAKRKAQTYPRNWADFQTWLDSILKDFRGNLGTPYWFSDKLFYCMHVLQLQEERRENNSFSPFNTCFKFIKS
jgi:curved DNA-binding protein CbpA